jgi:hypothetical protein
MLLQERTHAPYGATALPDVLLASQSSFSGAGAELDLIPGSRRLSREHPGPYENDSVAADHLAAAESCPDLGRAYWHGSFEKLSEFTNRSTRGGCVGHGDNQPYRTRVLRR